MQALVPLLTGFSDAAGGTARIYRRGTTTDATCYSDFKAANPLTGAHALDAKGRAVRYVNELVDVFVYDAVGAAITSFTYGHNATGVEVVHAHVTGVDYDTAASGTNKPNTLQGILDLLFATFGSNDFKIPLAGSTAFVKDAVVSNVFDLKAYGGAIGDGLQDDTVAVQKTLTAAANAEGIMWCPPGEYKVTSAITFPIATKRFKIMGASTGAHAGNPAARIAQYTNDAHLFDGSAGGAALMAAQDMGFAGAAAAGAGQVFKTLSAGSFLNCSITSPNTTGTVISVANGVTFTDCDLVFANGILITAATARFIASLVSGSFGAVVGATGRYHFVGCDLSGSGNLVNAGASAPTIHLVASQLGTRANLGNGSTALIYEAGCDLNLSSSSMGSPFAYSTWRDSQYTRTTGAAASYAPDAGIAMAHEVISSNAAFQWANPTNPPTVASHARYLTLRYKNTNAGAVTPTFGAAYKASSVAIASNSAAGWLFVFDSTLAAWVQIGSPVAYAS